MGNTLMLEHLKPIIFHVPYEKLMFLGALIFKLIRVQCSTIKPHPLHPSPPGPVTLVFALAGILKILYVGEVWVFDKILPCLYKQSGSIETTASYLTLCFRTAYNKRCWRETLQGYHTVFIWL